MAASPYVGKWQFAEIIDAESNNKPLPEGKTFVANIEVIDENQLRVAVKIGNSMSASFALVGEGSPESQEVKVTMGMSTRMMPPPEVYEIEILWNKITRTVTKVELSGDKLTFVGEGKYVLTKLESEL